MILARRNRGAVEDEAAKRLAELLRELLSAQSVVAFAVCGGRSVAGVFQCLARKELAWDRVHIFLTDERFVPLDDEESNFSLVKKYFVGSSGQHTTRFPAENIHPFKMEAGVAAYEKELLAVRDHYDVVLLSAGEDGHIGAIFPGHHSFNDDAPLFIEMDDSPKPPPRRMSMSREHVKKAHGAVVLFVGEGKRDALQNYQHTPEDACPARLAQHASHTYAITDIR